MESLTQGADENFTEIFYMSPSTIKAGMTAQQVTQDNLIAKNELSYTPVYMRNVHIINPFTNSARPSLINVNPYYCLTWESAAELMQILQKTLVSAGIEMVESSPLHWAKNSPFSTDISVPWFVFSNVTLDNRPVPSFPMNAGLMAMPFINHSYNLAVSMLLEDFGNMKKFVLAEGLDQVGF